jgi:hypothetical protein
MAGAIAPASTSAAELIARLSQPLDEEPLAEVTALRPFNKSDFAIDCFEKILKIIASDTNTALVKYKNLPVVGGVGSKNDPFLPPRPLTSKEIGAGHALARGTFEASREKTPFLAIRTFTWINQDKGIATHLCYTACFRTNRTTGKNVVKLERDQELMVVRTELISTNGTISGLSENYEETAKTVGRLISVLRLAFLGPNVTLHKLDTIGPHKK